MSVPRDQTEPRLATIHTGAGVLGTDIIIIIIIVITHHYQYHGYHDSPGQGADCASHCKSHNLLSLVVNDEVPGRLQPHGGAGGPGGEQTLRARTFIPSDD